MPERRRGEVLSIVIGVIFLTYTPTGKVLLYVVFEYEESTFFSINHFAHLGTWKPMQQMKIKVLLLHDDPSI